MGIAVRILLLASSIFGFSGLAHGAPRQKSDTVAYRVAKGDNLYTLAARYFRKTGSYAAVQHLNRITNPYRLRVGMLLVIPRALLRQKPVEAIVERYKGAVRIEGSAGVGPVSVGMVVREGDRIQTDRKSFVTLRLPDETVVALPSQTTVRIRRMRQTLLAGTVERLFAIERGRARAIVTPMDDPHSNFQISTPIAVSAVRGTRFRVSYDPDRNRATSEVLEGKVIFASGSTVVRSASTEPGKLSLTAGFGAASELSTAIPLLPAPDLVAPGRVQDDDQLQFDLKPLMGADGYRLQIARDAGFLDVLDEAETISPLAIFPSVPNGSYFVRATAIDPTGLEGKPATYGFERRLNRVEASVQGGDAGRYRQYLFRWRAPDAVNAQYRFQLSTNPDGATPMVDELGLTETAFIITDLPKGVYYWRVMTLDVLDGRTYEKWTPFRELRVEVSR